MLSRFAEARVFIVDDNAPNVALLRAVLIQSGLNRVFTETDSRLVVSRLAEVDPDLVLLDLHMPNLDGFAVLEQIRQFAPHEFLPVLVLTADTTSAASERALRAGAQDFVTKPFNNAEVVLRARNLLETRFLYTSLRGSFLKANNDHEQEERRLTQALASEVEAVDVLRFQHALSDTLLQTVSHDLRNPIAAVLAMTHLLAADASGGQPLTGAIRSSLIAKVERSARRMDRLLRDLLDSDPMREVSDRQIPCDVGDLVQRVLAEADLVANHPVETEIAPVWATVDPVHVERIVENLFSNVRDHVDPGVAIWVRVEQTGDSAVISVEDAGPGVPPELLDGIFEPFRRGANPRSAGFGLGLSLVSRFASLQGGRAWVEDRVGGGAAFRVSLPLTPAEVLSSASDSAN